MAIRGSTWYYIITHGNTLEFMVIHVCLPIHGNIWLYTVQHGDTWQQMVMNGDTWQYMIVDGNIWQHMAAHGDT